jgi:hypothetical protein
VVRAEAALSANEHPLTCLSCGAPLRNREGKYVLKYFRVDGRPLTVDVVGRCFNFPRPP